MPATRCFNRIEDLVCDNEQLTQQQSDLQARLLVLEERQRAWDRTRRLRKNIIAKVDRGQTVSITSCGRSEVFGPRESVLINILSLSLQMMLINAAYTHNLSSISFAMMTSKTALMLRCAT